MDVNPFLQAGLKSNLCEDLFHVHEQRIFHIFVPQFTQSVESRNIKAC